eukprot:GHVU01019419.1.p1 GENE.GHVU01019419.1~~GHVU01019419.1.p1  ORF type:complete len:154 (+),score=22.57 GHVU01019419.1:65-463(+)
MDSGFPHGWGEMKYANGDVMEGNWDRTKIDTYGIVTMRYANRDWYHGGWKDGRRHGLGELRLKDRSLFKGTWKNGKKDGMGQLRLPNGDVHMLTWQDNIPQDTEYRCEDGTTDRGSFDEVADDATKAVLKHC